MGKVRADVAFYFTRVFLVFSNKQVFVYKCFICGAEESPKFLPHQWAFGLGKDEACWPGVCPGSDRVLCHSSNGPGPGRQHSGVQDL